jgi:predicted nucleic acid-binding protein
MLVDTSALLAFMLKKDQHHRAAVEFVKAHPQQRFVLTTLILNELVTRLRVHADAARAAAAGRSLLDARRYDVVFVDAPLVRNALVRMEKLADKPLSLTDCASFELMDRLDLHTAFTFDTDFRDCGYQMVP